MLVAYITYILIFIFLITLTVAYVSEVYNTVIKRRPPYVASQKHVYDVVYDYLKDKDIHTFIEPACGDGKGLHRLAELSDWEVTGIEISYKPYFIYKFMRPFRYSSDKIQFFRDNCFNKDLSQADALYVYTFNDFNEKLEKKLLKELRKGTYVLSYAFTFPNLELIDTIPITNALHKQLYVYRI